MKMETMTGTRVNSQRRIPVQDDFYADSTYYESIITRLFTPFLVTEISDYSWQKLQEKLGRIIREIISKKIFKKEY